MDGFFLLGTVLETELEWSGVCTVSSLKLHLAKPVIYAILKDKERRRKV